EYRTVDPEVAGSSPVGLACSQKRPVCKAVVTKLLTLFALLALAGCGGDAPGPQRVAAEDIEPEPLDPKPYEVVDEQNGVRFVTGHHEGWEFIDADDGPASGLWISEANGSVMWIQFERGLRHGIERHDFGPNSPYLRRFSQYVDGRKHGLEVLVRANGTYDTLQFTDGQGRQVQQFVSRDGDAAAQAAALMSAADGEDWLSADPALQLLLTREYLKDDLSGFSHEEILKVASSGAEYVSSIYSSPSERWRPVFDVLGDLGDIVLEKIPVAKPYRVVDLQKKDLRYDPEDDATIGVCHRTANVIFTGEPSRAAISAAAGQVYADLKAEVERVCPNCRYKRVGVRMWHPDQEYGRGRALLIVFSNDPVGPEIADFHMTKLNWLDDFEIARKRLRGFPVSAETQRAVERYEAELQEQ
ncbi:MAG: hypothetical protein KY476_00480, partial [Planctomycetes bacterium]|nr:hypothetical protein [Planctomycetota bacterium]